jgi:SAM-dependent methyltransferase
VELTRATLERLAPYRPVELADGLTLGDLMDRIAEVAPPLLECLHPDRLSLPELGELFQRLDSESGMFEGGHRGGRGDGYRAGQLSQGVRKVAVRVVDGLLGDRRTVLDVLSGNGTLGRTLAHLGLASRRDLLCCDIARDMVAAAYRRGLPAWRQSADFMLVRDACADAVVFLYGTHHIPPERLEVSFAEAYRALRPGGRVLVQDFEEGTPSAEWFSVVLHRWTPQGHDFRHYQPGELAEHLRAVGFEGVEERRIYDPLEIAGPSEEAAAEALLDHVSTTWELEPLLSQPDGRERLGELVRAYGRCETGTWNPCELTEPGVLRREAGFEAVMPRMSLLAWGDKGP